MAIFPTFFLGNINQGNGFYDVLEQKNAFLGYKNKKFKRSINWHFSKWFWSTNDTFSKVFLLGNIGQDNVFYDILERKNAYLGYKNQKFKKSKKIHIFLKGLTHGSGPKMAIFPTSLLRQYRPGKCLLWYSRAKKRLSRL